MALGRTNRQTDTHTDAQTKAISRNQARVAEVKSKTGQVGVAGQYPRLINFNTSGTHLQNCTFTSYGIPTYL